MSSVLYSADGYFSERDRAWDITDAVEIGRADDHGSLTASAEQVSGDRVAIADDGNETYLFASGEWHPIDVAVWRFRKEAA